MKRCLILVLAAFVATIVAVEALFFYSGLYFNVLHRYYSWSDHQPARLLRTAVTLQSRLIAFGNSRARMAFRPVTFEAELGMPPDTVRSSSLAMIGAPLLTVKSFMQRLLKADSPPAVALIMLAPEDMIYKPTDLTPDCYELFDSTDDFPSAGGDPRAYVQLRLAYGWQLWRYHQQAADLLATMLTRGPTPEGMDYNRPTHPDPLWDPDRARNWYPADMPHWLKPAETHWEYVRIGGGRPPQDKYLREMLVLCRQRQIWPVLVWMPEFGHRSSEPNGAGVMTYLKSLDVATIVDMSDVCPAAANWQDPEHLNADGALTFSVELARRLGPSLRKVLTPSDGEPAPPADTSGKSEPEVIRAL